MPVALVVSTLLLAAGARQDSLPPALAQERAEYWSWLQSAANSPFAAMVLRPIGPGLTLGPADADIPLPGVSASTLTEEDRFVVLESGTRRLPLPRARPVPLGRYRISAGGPPGRTIVTVFGTPREGRPPTYFPYAPRQVHTVALTPPARPRVQPLLAPEGVEVEATDAGTVTVAIGGARYALRVMRLPVGGGEESDLEVYFRDATNGHGSYPAGRWVSLTPLGGNRYRLDFNRARNSFCAYNTVYPCPAPWRGNLIDAPLEAGERYAGGGLDLPASRPEPPPHDH